MDKRRKDRPGFGMNEGKGIKPPEAPEKRVEKKHLLVRKSKPSEKPD
jgi:hypothetical protein